MPIKDPVKRKAYVDKYRQQNREEIKAYAAKQYGANKEELSIRHAYIQTSANAMLSERVIYNKKIWNKYCNQKRQRARKYPFSEDFTDEIFFEKMKNGCVYCGSLATSIDRLDSSINHIPENCEGCCLPCNMSKGNGDRDSFLRKAYFRARGEYFDDHTDIWSDNIKKPLLSKTKKNADKKGVEFTMTLEEWDVLITGNCKYCSRSKPDQRWFGVDQVIPSRGYTPENTVSCCHDCNVDKNEYSIEDTRMRNENIAERLINGDIIIAGCSTVLRNTCVKAKKVCAYGKVYSSYEKASLSLGMNPAYVRSCIHKNIHPDNIFEISNDFYEFAVENNLENITKDMLCMFALESVLKIT